MADNKKYYYLKLKDNFFDSDAMIVLESMQDGDMYSNILLKLYLRSLKNDGKLMFNERIPYNSTILAQVTRKPVGVLEKALQIFKQLELVDILDNGAIYMLDIQNYIGKSSTEADRQRDYQSRIKQDKEGKLLPALELKRKESCKKSNRKSTPEIEIEIEKDIEIKKEKKEKKNTYGEFYSVKLTETEFKKLHTDYNNADELIEFLDEYIKMKGYKAKSHYLAIKKWVVQAVKEQKLRSDKLDGKGFDIKNKVAQHNFEQREYDDYDQFLSNRKDGD